MGLSEGLGEGREWTEGEGPITSTGFPRGIPVCWVLGLSGVLGQPSLSLPSPWGPMSPFLHRGEDSVLPQRRLSPRMPPTLGKVHVAASEQRRGGGAC